MLCSVHPLHPRSRARYAPASKSAAWFSGELGKPRHPEGISLSSPRRSAKSTARFALTALPWEISAAVMDKLLLNILGPYA